MLDRDTMLKPGQKVRVVRTVTVAYDLDISEWMDMSDFTEISVNELESDIEDFSGIRDILDENDDAEVTDVSVEITEIL